MKMKSWKVNDSTEEQKTKSIISIKVGQTNDWHAGTVEGSMTGLIVRGKYEGYCIGHATMIEGDSPVRIKFIGEFSNTKGSDSWVASADSTHLRYTGKWTVEKQAIK